MYVLRSLVVTCLAALSGCGGGESQSQSVPNMPAVQASLSVYESPGLSAPGCQGAKVYFRLQSDSKPFPEAVIEEATLFLPAGTLRLDLPLLLERQNGDLYATAAVCSGKIVVGGSVEGALRVSFPGVGTVDLQAPPTNVVPQKGLPPVPSGVQS